MSVSSNQTNNMKTFSVLKNFTPQQIQGMKADGEIMLTAREKTLSIWADIRKTDFYSQGMLQFQQFERIFEKHQNNIYSILQIQSPQEFFQIFDENHDGFLNEDDQILILSLIKEKIYSLAQRLREVQEYDLFKQLMKEVRLIELDINKFQNELRLSLYAKEKKQYVSVGEEKLQQFYNNFYDEFQLLKQHKRQALEEKNFQQLEEMEKLEIKLQKPDLRIKPKKKLKEYQTQEKLVIIEERVDEAKNYRSELKNLEVSEALRVDREILGKANHLRKNLRVVHEKEMMQLELQLEQQNYMLQIKLQKEFEVLKKQVKLHKHEIDRIQGICQIEAYKRGEIESDLRRRKMTFKQQNQIISESKQTNKSVLKVSTDTNENTTQNYRKSFANKTDRKITNAQMLTNLMKTGNLTNFYIRNSADSDVPVNSIIKIGQIKDQHSKITQLINQKTGSNSCKLPSLAELYDNQLELKKEFIKKDQQSIDRDNLEKKLFIEKIINPDRK